MPELPDAHGSALNADDVRFMRRALELAEKGAGHVSPNPKVGAVIVREGVVVGEGFHAEYGGHHAEVMALQQAGEQAHGATAYVTLEPCNHTGKTGPCSEALIAAGVRRVVFAIEDPNPIASGGGNRLLNAGIAVSQGVLRSDAADQNAPFLHAARHHDRPFVTLKLAVSIDGAIVDASRQPGWLTGEEARQAVHQLRAEANAIAVGIGTVLADDPALTVRYAPPPRVQPIRVVFDRRGRLPLTSQLVRTSAQVPVWVMTDGSNPQAEQGLRLMGITVQVAKTLPEALFALRATGFSHLVVEGGAILGSALLEAGLVDRLVIFQAPVILGSGALSAFASLPSRQADSAARFRVVERKVLGDDLMTTYAVSGD